MTRLCISFLLFLGLGNGHDFTVSESVMKQIVIIYFVFKC